MASKIIFRKNSVETPISIKHSSFMNEFLNYLRYINLVYFNSENEYESALEECLIINKLYIKDFLDQPLVDKLCISFQKSSGKYSITNGQMQHLNGLVVIIKKMSPITTKIFQNHLSLTSEIIGERDDSHSKPKQQNKTAKLLKIKMFDHNHNIAVNQNEQPTRIVEAKKPDSDEPSKVVEVAEKTVLSLTEKMSNIQVTPSNEINTNEPKESAEKRYFLRVRPTKKELFKSA